MLYQLIIAVCLLIFAVNLHLNLRSLRRPSLNARIPEPLPLVSILVPARNEEANIGSCLQSLLLQDYPNLEILVLDDNSSDQTSAIVRRFADADRRVQLLQGEELPSGWAGKPFACSQLAHGAHGDWLLFVDADTTHALQMVRATIALAQELKASLVSGFPRQIANSLPQKVAIPVLYFIIFSWLPLWYVQRARKLRPSLAIGQFLLFRTEDYLLIGGHEAVKSRILEDVWLAIEIVRHGGKHVAVDLSRMVSCNMYRDVGAMREGFVRWTYSVAVRSPLALGGMIIAGLVFYLAPYFWLLEGLSTATYSGLLMAVIGCQVFIIHWMRSRLDIHLREPLISSLLHPLGFSFLFLCSSQAMYRMFSRSGVSWKQRVYDRDSSVE